MIPVFKIVSYLGLVLIFVTSILVFLRIVSLSEYKILLLVGSVLWLANAPFWMFKKAEE
ncbi:hypothetical protein HX109_11700 [Galbibacter sp. BG1]|uniref:hypothetical protein n=1 Tax=Galbibacter sp. BG1 TaxID=1170699 RepID=UPI0015BEAA08|nr:hypothetical protein [Galbibacter sp. BG1]QLE02186.1 hypothetical protein HX109_11700 [Galbibacter sp. BG1]